MGPVVAGIALGPLLDVGLGVVVHDVAVWAVLVLLVAQSARVAEVQDLALDETVAPEGRIGGVAVGALVVVHPRAGGALGFLVWGRRNDSRAERSASTSSGRTVGSEARLARNGDGHGRRGADHAGRVQRWCELGLVAVCECEARLVGK